MRIKDKEKEAAIVRATLELTEAKGLAGIKMTTLAKRAGIATGSLYTYFADKQELLTGVYDSVWDHSLTYTTDINQPDWGVKEILREFVLSYARFVAENRAAVVFIEQMKHSPFLTPDAEENLLARYQPLVDAIEAGTKEGLVKDVPAHELLYVIEGIVKSVINYQTTMEQPGPRVGEICWEYAWAAIKK